MRPLRATMTSSRATTNTSRDTATANQKMATTTMGTTDPLRMATKRSQARVWDTSTALTVELQAASQKSQKAWLSAQNTTGAARELQFDALATLGIHLSSVCKRYAKKLSVPPPCLNFALRAAPLGVYSCR